MEAGWSTLHVRPLAPDKSLELIEAIGGPEIANRYGERLVEISGGLPIQICPVTSSLKRRHERGLDRFFEPTLAEEAKTSFSGVYNILEDHQLLMVHAAAHLNVQRISRSELFLHLQEATEMADSQLAEVLGACMDLHMLEGSEELRMHQLFASFVRDIRLEGDLTEPFKRVTEVQVRRFVELAEAVRNAPADSNLVAFFYDFSPLARGMEAR